MTEPSPSRARRYFAPRFSLRTLIFLMLLGGPLGGWGWTRWQVWKEWQIQEEARQQREKARSSRAKASELAQIQAIQDINMQAVIHAMEAIAEAKDPREVSVRGGGLVKD